MGFRPLKMIQKFYIPGFCIDWPIDHPIMSEKDISYIPYESQG